MSWTRVDFALVRYSPVEGTHYFFDPAYPTTIQFLLEGRWESWDVGWVKHNAQDPDVKRIAEDAESRLINNQTPGYRPWPSAPPPGPAINPAINGYPLPPNAVESPLQSPLTYTHSSPTVQSPPSDLSADYPAISPQSYVYPASAAPPHPAYYASPYAAEPSSSSSTSHPNQPAPVPSRPSQPGTAASGPGIPETTTSSSAYQGTFPSAPGVPQSSNGAQDFSAAPPGPPGPPSQPTTAPPIMLSRNRETKILLSLDGDGIRGLAQVLLVESLVNAVCTKIGAPVEPYQVFDLIGGTSMGGVLAILLSRLRMQAHQAREAYKHISKEVFPNKRDFFTSFDPHVPPSSQESQSVDNVIKAIVAREVGNQEEPLLDSREDSSDVFVVSTRIDIGTNKAALMRSFQTRRITGPELDANMTIWQAMRATSVAPRYMRPRDGINWRPVIEPGLVDHGTAKNNPIRDILYECRKLYRYANDMMIIVSVGTGTGYDRARELPEMAKSIDQRTQEAAVWGEKFEADHQALMERGWMKYFRFNVPGLDDVPLEEWCHEEKIKEKTFAYLGRPDIGQVFYACVDAITTVLLTGQHAPRG